MIKLIKKYFSHQIKEINSSKALIYFGAFLSFIHILSFEFWNHHNFYYFTAIDHPSALCHSFLDSACQFIRFNSPLMIKTLWFFYLLIAIFSIYLFLKKNTKIAYYLLLILNFFKFFILILSLKHMGNYHYMPFIISFIYLFMPHKRINICFTVFLLYLFAGILKLYNLEWLSGGSLYNLSGLNHYFIVFLTSSVIFLEIFISPFLLLKNRLKYLAFSLFILFHCISWYWVGWYYPLNCFSFIALFPLLWFLEKDHRNTIDLIIQKKTMSSFLILSFFVLFQLTPRFYEGDASLTGQGRFFALNMYDATTSCHSLMKLRFKNRTEEISRSDTDLSVRIRCLPYVYYTDAKKACQFSKHNPDFIDMDLHLHAKRRSDKNWKYLVRIKNFCSKNIKYHLFKENAWINTLKN